MNSRIFAVLLSVAVLVFAGCSSTPSSSIDAESAVAKGPVMDFSVAPAVGEGGTFRLSDYRGKFVAAHFLLKTECPVCGKYVHEYVRAAEELGIEHVFLKPDTDAEIQTWAKKYATSDSELPTIYRDPDAQLAKKLKIPFGYKFHGQTVHYPALVLFDREGREVFRYVGEGTRDRYYPHRLAEKLRQVRGY